MIIQRYLNGFQYNDEIATLRMQKKYPSPVTQCFDGLPSTTKNIMLCLTSAQATIERNESCMMWSS